MPTYITAGEGTRNYVVFDDALVSIVKKYMLAGLAFDQAVQMAQQERAQGQAPVAAGRTR